MAKPRIQPVRYRTKRGWQTCRPHEAQQWEVRAATGKLLGRYLTKAEATDCLTCHNKRKVRPQANYKLGKPMGPRTRGTLYSSKEQ